MRPTIVTEVSKLDSNGLALRNSSSERKPAIAPSNLRHCKCNDRVVDALVACVRC